MTITATKSAIKGSKLEALGDRLVDMANVQHGFHAYARLFSVSLTIDRVRAHHLQKTLLILNRRACWAYAQAAAPFDVKQSIWQHEEEELGNGKMRGLANHYEFTVKQSAPFGLTADDYVSATPSDVTRTFVHVWIRLAKNSLWLNGALRIGHARAEQFRRDSAH